MTAWLAEATGALLMAELATGPIIGGTLWVLAFAVAHDTVWDMGRRYRVTP